VVPSVKLEEIKWMVSESTPEDWSVLPDGPTYHDWISQVASSGQRWVEVDSHHSVVVYKDDVDLRLAWGLTHSLNLSFDGWSWPDKSISRLFVDVFWRGALVDRRHVLLVDGGRCYLPNPARAHVRTGESIEDSETIGWTATKSDVALARLLQRLARPGDTEFEGYLEQSGVIEVD
jgi:hypothetical protein